MAEKKTVKQKIQTFGVKKFSILIIGLIVCLVGILYITLHNNQGGLLSISYQEYQEYFKKGSGTKFIYVSGDDELSQEFLPILNDVLKEESLQASYLDMTKIIKDGKETEFMGLTPMTKESYMIPMIIVMKDQKAIDSVQGYTDKTALKSFIKKYNK